MSCENRMDTVNRCSNYLESNGDQYLFVFPAGIIKQISLTSCNSSIRSFNKNLFPSPSITLSLLASKLIDLSLLRMRIGYSISCFLQRYFITIDKLSHSVNTDLSDPLK